MCAEDDGGDTSEVEMDGILDEAGLNESPDWLGGNEYMDGRRAMDFRFDLLRDNFSYGERVDAKKGRLIEVMRIVCFNICFSATPSEM